jgi:shikimate dehydrogenase
MTATSAAGPHAFVVGWPIAQSRSPLIHGHWLKVHGLAGSYEKLAVPPEEIEAFLRDLPTSGWVGGNVTVPHKEIAYRIATERDEVAEAMGAVNTLWIDGGRICGTNTDAIGFIANLDDRAAGWDANPGVAVVLGAGGAARAVVWGLIRRGFTVRIVNRTLARAEELAARFGAGTTAHGFDEVPRLLAEAEVLVNTTSLGMAGKDDLAIDLAPLSPDTLVTDIVYVPLVTPLLAAAEARGLRTVDGLGMLLHQAVGGFERWFGVRPTVTDELRALVLADIG